MMKTQIIYFGIVFFVFVVLVDLYTWRGLHRVFQTFGADTVSVVRVFHFGLSIIAVLSILFVLFRSRSLDYDGMMQYTKNLMGFVILFYVPKLFFIIFLLVRDILAAGFSLFLRDSAQPGIFGRLDYLLMAGLLIMLIFFVSIFLGIVKGRFNYTVEKIELSFKDLPDAFDGFTIAQISDLHIGSFNGKVDKLKPAVEKINALNPDLVVFTGDMVNNLATEMLPFIPLLNEISGKHGKYSILGNHDYAEYIEWDSREAYKANMEQLFANEEEAGFKLLRNESVKINIEDQHIVIA